MNARRTKLGVGAGAVISFLGLGLLSARAMVVSDPDGFVAVGTTNENTDAIVAYSTDGCASGFVAVSTTCSDNWTCDWFLYQYVDPGYCQSQGVAVSTNPNGHASGSDLAVSGGNANGNGFGGPYPWPDQWCTYPAEIAISGTGNACAYWIAVAPFGNATTYSSQGIAVGQSADAIGRLPQDGPDYPWGLAAVSTSGQAQGGMVDISANGTSSAQGGPVPTAISLQNGATSSGGTAPIAVSGTGNAETCGGTAPVQVSGGAFLGTGGDYPCGY